MIDLITSDFDCESCHTTEGATYYSPKVSALRLCGGCFVTAGGEIDAPEERTATQMLSDSMPDSWKPKAVAPIIIRRMSASSSDALEEHTAVLSQIVARVWPDVSVENPLRDEPEHALERVERPLLEESNLDLLPSASVSSNKPSEPLGNRTETGLGSVTNPSDDCEPLDLSVTSVTTSVRRPVLLTPKSRKRQSWPAYTRQRAYTTYTNPVPRVDRVEYPEPTYPMPPRARDIREGTIRKAVHIPEHVREEKIHAAQHRRCVYCYRHFGWAILHNGEVEILTAQPDHFKPRAIGGRTSDSNIDYACHVCNRLKSDYLFETVELCQEFLTNEWARKGYTDCPLLVPFREDVKLIPERMTKAMAAGKYN